MRVIAGTAKRTPLVAPWGLATRPTADRAKEGLFNILSSKITGARFLDLFCGSGAIGIEALSRGAAEVVFVEQAKYALEALNKNLAATKLVSQNEIMFLPVLDAIKRLQRENRIFDIIFLDPPYDGDFLQETISFLAESFIIDKNGLVIAETEVNRPIPDAASFSLEQQRDYGRSRFLFYRMMGCCVPMANV